MCNESKNILKLYYMTWKSQATFLSEKKNHWKYSSPDKKKGQRNPKKFRALITGDINSACQIETLEGVRHDVKLTSISGRWNEEQDKMS